MNRPWRLTRALRLLGHRKPGIRDDETPQPGIVSEKLGTSGICLLRFAEVTPSARTFPAVALPPGTSSCAFRRLVGCFDAEHAPRIFLQLTQTLTVSAIAVDKVLEQAFHFDGVGAFYHGA